MIGIGLSTLRARRASFVGAFVALFCASAFIGACGLLLQTGLRGTIAPQRYAAAPAIVAADQSLHFVKHHKDRVKTKTKPATESVRMPESVLATVRSTSGVANAVPDVTFPATILGGSDAGPSWGHGWGSARLTPYTLAHGRAPVGADEVVVDADAGEHVGDTVLVQTPQRTAKYAVVGVTAQALTGQPAVFFSDATADDLAGHRLTAIGVWPAHRTAGNAMTAALTAALSHTHDSAIVYTGDDRGTVEVRDSSRAKGTLTSMSGAMGGTALLVAVLVVVGTLTLSIEQRGREIALLRAIGATPRQVRRMLTGEALVVTVLAAAAGSVAGLPLAGWLHGRFAAYGVIPDRLDLVRGPLPLVAAFVVTVAAGLLAVRVAGRHATRIRPTAALAQAEAVSRPPSVIATALGTVLLAAGIGLIALLNGLHSEPAAMPVSMLAVVVCAGGLALLGPIVARLAAAALGSALRVLPSAGYLGGENLRANPRRLAAVLTPMTLAVGMAVVVLFMPATLAGAAHRQVEDGTTATYTLTGAGAGLPQDVADAARAAPGVTAVTQVLHSTIWIGKNRYPAQGVTPTGLGSTMDLGIEDGSIRHLGDHAVAVSTTTAHALGLHVGDTLDLRLGDGTPVTATVAATYRRGLGFAAFTLPYDLLLGHVDVPLASSILITAPASAAPALHALAQQHPGVRVSNHAAAVLASGTASDSAARYIALGLVIAFTAIAIVNTLALATLDRRRELSLLRRIGLTQRQTLWMVWIETFGAVTTALALGGTIGLADLAASARGMTGSAALDVPRPAGLAVVVALVALAAVGSLAPARLVLRRWSGEG